ncbi:hypothetical protein [Bradyrhizobium sp. AZCC 2230]|uniref:hypothetical protein n=1 Tax=Bradyrhizobium sp. AZCC 2230 TaxID=3117021 RepID=UPI002FEF4C10
MHPPTSSAYEVIIEQLVEQQLELSLVARGAECVILGCTEITMLVGAADTSVETFETTAIHAETAADFAIG